MIQTYCREENKNVIYTVIYIISFPPTLEFGEIFTHLSGTFYQYLTIPDNCRCVQMAAVWQIHKMHKSVASDVELPIRRHFLEHGSVAKITSCRVKKTQLIYLRHSFKSNITVRILYYK